MRVAIVGTGYVGLVTGVCFADFGHSVICVDKNPEKIKTLQAGGVPIFEPGLEGLIQTNVQANRLQFTTSLTDAMKDAEVVFIAVGTPSRRDDGFADLSYVYAAAEEIADNIDSFVVVVNKSTVPVGTGDGVESIIAKKQSLEKFAVVSNPEFLREGAAIDDFKTPDRVVVGTDDKRARNIMRTLYHPLVLNETPIVFTSRRTSELIKYAANAFLATKIAFINEIADLCEAVGADVLSVSKGIGLDKRIGNRFLNAGPGYGGSCFPKDTLALVRTGEKSNVNLSVVKSVVSSNDTRKTAMTEKILSAVGRNVSGKTIAVLGLAFKPNTDDMRDAPSLTIIQNLQNQGAQIRAYDPEAMEEAKHLLRDVIYTQDPYLCAEGADAIVIVTEWDQFRALDMVRVKDLLAEPVLVDLRNLYNPGDMRKLGIEYTSVGR